MELWSSTKVEIQSISNTQRASSMQTQIYLCLHKHPKSAHKVGGVSPEDGILAADIASLTSAAEARIKMSIEICYGAYTLEGTVSHAETIEIKNVGQ